MGNRARRRFLVEAGVFNYGLSDRAMPTDASQLSHRSWISEAVLWTKWRHRGKLSAVTAGELITISPTVFVELMAMNVRAWKFARSYALGFIEFINMVTKKVSLYTKHNIKRYFEDQRKYIWM